MADDENFDIDLYGEDEPVTNDNEQPAETQEPSDKQSAEHVGDAQLDGTYDTRPEHTEDEDLLDLHPGGYGDSNSNTGEQQRIATTNGPSSDEAQLPRQAPVQQGLKRKEGTDDRPVDAGATSAIMVSELNWWTNDDDIRGWANQCECEDELKEVTFSEHKVNGKSKGQAYIEFASSQAATSVKHFIENFSKNLPAARKHIVAFASSSTNPFKTLPKDNNPARQNNGQPRDRSISSNYNNAGGGGGNQGGGYNNGGFRARGGMSNRGGMRGGFNSGGFAGQQLNGMNNGGYAAASMGNNFATPMAMGNMGGFNNNFNRGGNMMGGMRGAGRGGFNAGFNRGGGMMPAMGAMGAMGGMNGMPNMGGMTMGAIGGMPMMNAMPGGFGAPQGHFNPAFFPAQQMGAVNGMDQWNPHGAKRARPE